MGDVMGVLQDKVVVITGSSRGFGLAIARACGAEGAKVVVSARDPAKIAAVAAELRDTGLDVTGVACDVSRMEQVEELAEAAFAAYGRLDVWINNAGYTAPWGPTAHLGPSTFMRVVETNIVGVYNGSIAALRRFLPARRGKLINILGRGSDGRGAANQNAYSASKAWEASFTRTLAKEYQDTGVGVYALNPGMMTTELLTDVTVVSGYEGYLKRTMPTIVRMWGASPEIPARKVVWLASPATDGKTGLSIHMMGPRKMVGGALREGLARLTGRKRVDPELTLTLVPATMPLPTRHGEAAGEKWQR
jgi:NAD(P)-dependent dehydrogenase (short-subunit alcohol dehydrogenase family)